MLASSTSTNRSLALLAVGLLFPFGCAEKQTAQVSGTVRYTDGSNIEGGKRVIQFLPAKDSAAVTRKGATGLIDPKTGEFQMMTRQPGDGVYRGTYNIAFAIETSPYDGTSLIKSEYTAGGSGDWPFPPVVVDSDIEGLLFELEKK